MKQYLNNISTVDIGRYIGLGQGKKELTDELRMKILTDYHFWFPDDSFDIPNKVSIIDGRTEKKKKRYLRREHLSRCPYLAFLKIED